MAMGRKNWVFILMKVDVIVAAEMDSIIKLGLEVILTCCEKI